MAKVVDYKTHPKLQTKWDKDKRINAKLHKFFVLNIELFENGTFSWSATPDKYMNTISGLNEIAHVAYGIVGSICYQDPEVAAQFKEMIDHIVEEYYD